MGLCLEVSVLSAQAETLEGFLSIVPISGAKTQRGLSELYRLKIWFQVLRSVSVI